MAMIKCYKCGHQVSDKALKCPNCGNIINYEKLNKNTNTSGIIYLLMFIIIPILIVIMFSNFSSNTSSSSSDSSSSDSNYKTQYQRDLEHVSNVYDMEPSEVETKVKAVEKALNK